MNNLAWWNSAVPSCVIGISKQQRIIKFFYLICLFYYFSAKIRISDKIFTRESINMKARFSIKPDTLHYVKYNL